MSQYVYNKHNDTWKVICTAFTHSLFLYQKSQSFATLTRSISDKWSGWGKLTTDKVQNFN